MAPNPQEVVIVLHPGYATGDIWAVSAYMALNPKVRVAISTQRAGTARGKVDKSTELKAILDETVINLGGRPADRVGIVPLEKMAGVRHNSSDSDVSALALIIDTLGGEDLTVDELRARLRKDKKNESNRNYDFITIGPSFVTDRCAATWLSRPDDARTVVRHGWGLGEGQDRAIGTWLRERYGFPAQKQRVAVLWSRWTGKGGETKPEHDTSFQGLRDMVDIALVRPETVVIITGDKPERSDYGQRPVNRPGKITQIATDRGARVFDMTGFWDRLWSGAETRLHQIRLWDYLTRRYGRVRHLGFRSGNLEALAMAGCTVRYFEEASGRGDRRPPPGSERMNPFNNDEIGYWRLPISQVPTRTGQYAIKQNLQEDLPAWITDPTQPKPDDVRAFGKGFATEDKEKIKNYLNPEAITTPAPSPPPSPRQPGPPPRMEVDLERSATIIPEPPAGAPRSSWLELLTCCFPA